MSQFDVFNGDADGICALHQLRLAAPKESTLVTGVKRDIALLNRVPAVAGDQVTVLDISLDKNRDALLQLLEQGAEVLYFDHHFAGEIPQHTHLETHINTEGNVCSALLVNGYLGGSQRAWAVVGAFGDNLHDSAHRAAEPLALSADQLEQLKQLGTYLNYNGYGATPEDLHFHPADLYQQIQPYSNPLLFIAESDAYKKLASGYADDMSKSEQLKATIETEANAVFVLPNEPWARRVSGVLGNDLARKYPRRAHALLTLKQNGNYLISVRAPLATKTGADDLCRQFATGGGRKAAAGVNDLPESEYDAFIQKFQESFSGLS